MAYCSLAILEAVFLREVFLVGVFLTVLGLASLAGLALSDDLALGFFVALSVLAAFGLRAFVSAFLPSLKTPVDRPFRMIWSSMPFLIVRLRMLTLVRSLKSTAYLLDMKFFMAARERPFFPSSDLMASLIISMKGLGDFPLEALAAGADLLFACGVIFD